MTGLLAASARGARRATVTQLTGDNGPTLGSIRTLRLPRYRFTTDTRGPQSVWFARIGLRSEAAAPIRSLLARTA